VLSMISFFTPASPKRNRRSFQGHERAVEASRVSDGERERERARRASSVLSIAQLVRDAVLAQGACEVFPEPRESCPNWYWHSRARNGRLSPSTDAGHSSQGSAPPLMRRQLVFDGPRKTSPRSRCVPPAGSFADLNRAEPAQEVRSRSAAAGLWLIST